MRSKPVVYRTLGSAEWTHSSSMTFAALELGVSLSLVSRACRHKAQLKGYEIRVADLHQPELAGEEWRPMLCPVSGEDLPNRMVSSQGRLKTRTGLIHTGCLRNTG